MEKLPSEAGNVPLIHHKSDQQYMLKLYESKFNIKMAQYLISTESRF